MKQKFALVGLIQLMFETLDNYHLEKYLKINDF